LFLLDAEQKALTLCERDQSGVFQVVRNLPLPVSDFASLQPIALGAASPNAVAFLGLNSSAWLPLDGQAWELTELDGYETPIRDGHLNDVVSGDLDNDGRKDLVFLETARNYLDLVMFDASHKLVPSNRWQVFEESERAVLVPLAARFEGLTELAVIPVDGIADEVAAIYRHELNAPLHIELGGLEPAVAARLRLTSFSSGLLLQSIGDLLHHPEPPVDLLVMTKDFAKTLMDHPDGALPKEVAGVIYWTCIAAALVRCRRRITSHDNAKVIVGFDWASSRSWIDPASAELLSAARNIVAQEAAEP
jgi:hypothetical protein